MTIKLATAVGTIAFGLLAGAASAATLTITGTPDQVLNSVPNGYNPSPATIFDVPVSDFGADSNGGSIDGGVFLDLGAGEFANITYRIEGQESGFFNVLNGDGTILQENAIGATTSTTQMADGFLNFGFTSLAYDPDASIWNGGTADLTNFNLGIGEITMTSASSWDFFIYFGDGTNDNDFDDLVASVSVDVGVVPLPASALFLLAGLGGLGLMRRKSA